MPLVSLPFLLLVSPPRLARPRRLALFRAGKRREPTPARALPPAGRARRFLPRPRPAQTPHLFTARERRGQAPACAIASPFSGPGGGRSRTPARALPPVGRARRFLPRPCPAPAPRPFRGPGGRSQAPARALPPDGRAKRFPSFKRRRPAGRGGAFPARPQRPALYGSRGKKEPNVWPGRASSAGSRGSRRAGRVHSTFQAVSSRRAQRMNFR